MRFQILDTHTDSIDEHDQETAVQTSHNVSQSHYMLLESPGGVRFRWIQEESFTSYSSIEPNFDHLEKTGNAVWESSSDGHGKHTSILRFDGLYIASGIAPVSQHDFELAERHFGNVAWRIESDDDVAFQNRSAVVNHFSGHDGRPTKADRYSMETQELNFPASHVPLHLDAKIDAVQFSQAVSEGSFLDVPLSSQMEALILAAEALHLAIANNNDAIVMANRANAARAHVAIAIDRMTDDAHQDVKRSFARP